MLEVTPGRRTTFVVQPRSPSGATGCPARLTMTVAARPPGRVRGLALVAHSASAVVIGWQPASRGDAPIAGYRVSLDGAVAGQTRSRRYALILNSARTHRVRVSAVDTRGRVGVASSELVLVATAHGLAALGAPPSTPEGVAVAELGETDATVWWLASRAGGTRLAGYRVYRDGQLVGETSALSLHLTHLDSPRTYAIAVAAVDSDGAESAVSQTLALTTRHSPPSAPTLLSATHVSDTSATLSWQAGTAKSGSVAGYLLFKDGQPVGLVQGQLVTVELASARSYTFAVRTVDSAGYLSAPSGEVTILTTHTPPAAPKSLSVGAVTSGSASVSWSAATPVSGKIVGYRVFRDETPVAQTSATEMTLQNLAPSSEYTITVTAVDSLGAVSEPSAPVVVRTAEPTPTHGSTQAYVLATTDESFQDLEAHYQQIGVIYPTYFECGAGGAITGRNDALVTGWALKRKIEVLPRVNCLNVADEEAVLGDAAVREKTISELAALCRTYGYSGIQIDYEDAPPADREPFSAFIKLLAERLHAQGSKLSTVVTGKYWNVPTGRSAMYNDAALAVFSDYVFVLDWGTHWVFSAPGSIDEYGWFKRVAEYTATMPDLSKFVLGMPLYGVDWPVPGGPSHEGTALEYELVVELAARLGITPEWESGGEDPHFSYTAAGSIRHEVWYVDQRSLAVRAALAASLGMKVGLWRLGHEDQSIWQLPQLGGEGQR